MLPPGPDAGGGVNSKFLRITTCVSVVLTAVFVTCGAAVTMVCDPKGWTPGTLGNGVRPIGENEDI